MPAMAQQIIKMATTTSTENSGLLSYILPIFEQQSGYKVHVIATGSGNALRLARAGDVDVVMTHAPEAEKQFLAQGYGISARRFMENDFIIVGPDDDPAGIANVASPEQAFQWIAKQNALFISRGDDSGTEQKELQIWQRSGVSNQFENYKAVGQGMGKTLMMADSMQAYALSDRGTFITYRDKLSLSIIYQGGISLANPYQIILLNQQKYPELNHQGAKRLSDWLIGETGQQLINNYTVKGQQLFKANYSE
ncbi:tungsten ABC transporter substrate-binding protein [Thalassotalea sp. HSM 43]|uniref:substrate-binding domain-containing protein n=1 Tax=Thalassotalea sp. HSM 43 TaxID=2552945 RepID=UPI0010819372|nr:substrate-binding domain-containing protein [Thalassotalea sp. HSM 43]QBY06229.1 tungsten ABC transporter substrate-binding protein [Thalassotalea sp. HSM 43]